MSPIPSDDGSAGVGAALSEEVAERQFLSIVLDTTSALILVLDADGRIVRFNRACQTLTGYTLDEVVGRPFWSIVLDAWDVGEVRAVFDQLRAGLAPTYHEHFWVARDSTRYWTSWRHTPVLDEQGSIQYVVCCGIQVSEVQVAQTALARFRKHYLYLLDELPVLVWRCNTSAECDYVNRTWLDFTGRAMEQELGHGWTADVHEDDLPTFMETFHRAFEQRAPFEMIYRLRRHDGVYRWIVDSGRPIDDENGAFRGFLGGCWDVSELHEAREALATRAQELARSNAELERFAYVASHDLQEPLRMVASFTQLLAQRYRGQLDADADEYIEFAVDGATRMKELIIALLEYARVGSQAKPPEAVSSSDCFADACQNLRAAIDESGAQVEADDLPVIRADRSEITRVLQNLIANAIKFRSAAPPVVTVSAKLEGNAWVFSVEDNGIGLEPRHAERIFQLFQRLHTRADYPGTGMGLAMCKKIVERLGGRIWVESLPGSGSVFRFTIPR